MQTDDFSTATMGDSVARPRSGLKDRDIPPPPPIYWNHEVGGKILFDLWAATSYGQNLEPEGLSAA
jgi:hypothetical protein